jgi:predicted dehydrogenase/nucleoside-diphosphate-sugar epimerase
MDSFSPNNVIKVGIIGAGYIAHYHMKILSCLKNVKVLCCCDVNLARAINFKKFWILDCAYDDIDRFLEENRLDIAHVVVPPDYHYLVAKKTLEHEVNVFLEKPMCVNSEECEELIRLAEKNGVQIGVNHNMVFHPFFLKMREDIKKGLIGDIDHVFCFQSGLIGQIIPKLFSQWMLQEPKNILLEQAPHPISQIRVLLGDVEDIKATVSDKRSLGYNQLFYDRWQAFAKCQRGSASLHLTFGRQVYPQSLMHVTGQDGSIHVDLLNGLYLVQKKSVFPDYIDPLANAARYYFPIVNGFKNFRDYVYSKFKLRGRSDFFFVGLKNSIEAFHTSFLSGKNIPVNGRDGQKVVEFCEKWIESAKPKENPKPLGIGAAAKKEGNAEIFITGATGFIGRCMIKHFVRQEIPVRILARSLKGLSELFHSKFVEVIQGDLLDSNKVEEVLHGVKYVFHLAHSLGETWEDFYKLNVDSTRHLAEVSLKINVKYFIFTSTIAAYHLHGKINEQTPIDQKPQCRNFYARSKIVLENMLVEMYKAQALPLIIFRPAIVIGEGGTLYHGGVGEWTRDNVCAFWGNGKNKLPFILVEDVVSAIVKVLEIDGLEGQSFNLAGDLQLSAREYISYLQRYYHRNVHAFPYPIHIRYLSEALKYFIKMLSGDSENALLSYRDLKNRSTLADFDNSKTKAILNWLPNQDFENFIHKGFGWDFERK